MKGNSKIKTFLTKISRYALPILIILVVLDIVLFATDILSKEQMKYFLFIPAILEFTFLIIFLVNFSHVIKRKRVLIKAGAETFSAWQEALEEIFPPRMARIILMEPRLYHALYISFKKKHQPGSSASFPTRLGNHLFLVKAIITLCLFEIIIVSLLLPSHWLSFKIIHLVLGIWAIVWLWADVQSMRIYPHQITGKGIKFQSGLRYRQEIPWKLIGEVKQIDKRFSGFGPGVDKKEPGSLFLSTGENCNVEIGLNHPQSFQGMIVDSHGIHKVYLSLEKPQEFIGKLLNIVHNEKTDNQ